MEKFIQTIVTDDGYTTMNWFNKQKGQEIVGFDLEWRHSFGKGLDNKTTLIHLCTDDGFFIIQMLFLDSIPESLVRFLKYTRLK